MITCLNCGHSFKGNFCSNCGQKATVKRITATVLLEDVIHFFTHLEKGFLFTTWNFIVRPGSTSLYYLEGKRKKYQGPVSYFLIWTGLYILAHNLIISYHHFRYQLSAEIFTQLNMREQANVLLRTHFTLFIIPLILLTALLIYILLASPRFNFIEIFTACLYGAGTYFMMLFISDMVLGLIFKVNTISAGVFLWQTILSLVYNFWFSYDFFKRVHLRLLWLWLISVAFLTTVIGWAIMYYLPLAWIYLTD